MRVALGATLVVLAVYLMTASGHLRGQDQEYFYRMARAIARKHTFVVEPLVLNDLELAGARGREGRFYAQYAPGLPLLLAPIILLTDNVELPADETSIYRWPHQNEADIMPRILTSYANVPISALSAGLLVWLVLRLGYSTSAALFGGFAFAFSTFLWGQSRIVFAEPLQTFFLLAACVLLINASAARRVLGGGALALAMLVKLTSLLALPVFLLLPDERGVPLWRRRSNLIPIIAPVVIGIAFYAWHNWMRFGSLTATGYTTVTGNLDFVWNPLIGLYGLLLSVGRGLVWYAPLCVLSALVWPRFHQERHLTSRAFVAFAILWLALHSFYKSWDGGWGWGPRYLLPILPFALTPLAASWSSGKVRSWAFALVGLGSVIQLPGALVDFMDARREGIGIFQQTCQECTEQGFIAWCDFKVAGAEIVRHAELLVRGKVDLGWITFAHTWLATATLAAAAISAACGVVMLALSLRSQPKQAQP